MCYSLLFLLRFINYDFVVEGKVKNYHDGTSCLVAGPIVNCLKNLSPVT